MQSERSWTPGPDSAELEANHYQEIEEAMKLNKDTPRTNDQIGHNRSTSTLIDIDFTRRLERELNQFHSFAERVKRISPSELSGWHHEVLAMANQLLERADK